MCNYKTVLCCVIAFIVAIACTKENSMEQSLLNPEQVSTIVSINEAEQKLDEIIQIMNVTKSAGAERKKIVSKYGLTMKDVPGTKSNGDQPYAYIFNFENESGFAVMSADKRVTPLLAYAMKGNVEENAEIDNPGLAVYMSLLEDYFEKTLGNDSVDVNASDWSYTISSEYYDMINGFCPVKWGQGAPYNYYCPSTSGIRTMTGCVATATAQLMCAYQYPESYNGYEFDWDNMIKSYWELDSIITSLLPENSGQLGGFNIFDYELDTGMSQTARLMQQLGLPENLNMDYGPYMSTSNRLLIIRTLENMGYASGGEMMRFDPSTVKERLERVKRDLREGYYCIAAGDQFTRDENGNLQIENVGHVWLLHGMMTLTYTAPTIGKSREEDYFLCNYGWDGDSDGYYLAGVFDIHSGPVLPDPVKSSDLDETKEGFTNVNYIFGIRK